MISIKLLCNFFEITLRRGCSPICGIFSEYLFLRRPLDGCFYIRAVFRTLSNIYDETCNRTEIVLRHGYSPVNLLHIFRILFLNNTSGGLLMKVVCKVTKSMKKSMNAHENLNVCELKLPKRENVSWNAQEPVPGIKKYISSHLRSFMLRHKNLLPCKYCFYNNER